MKQLILLTALGTLIAVAVSGCGGSPSSPTAPTTVNVTYSPPSGATITNGTSCEIRVEDKGAKGPFFTTIAFIRDDGIYSPPMICGQAGGSGSGGGIGHGFTHDARIAPLNFAVGHRVNLVVLFSSHDLCGSTFTGNAPAVDPAQADLGRKDVTLDWLVSG